MRRIAVAIGALAVLAAGGVAFAQTTGDERIYACVSNGDGAMRQIAGPDVVCAKNWHQISWSAENSGPEIQRSYRRSGDPETLQPGQTGSAFALCNDGDIATGGGFNANSDPDFKVTAEGAVLTTGDVEGWQVNVYNQNDAQGGFQARVVCLDLTP